MTDHLLRKGRGWGRAAQIACALVSIVGAGSVGGCLNRPIQPNEPKRTTTIVEPFTQSAVDKIDLLLMIDNSRSMADKQLILAAAVPDLVGALVNPKCVDPKGTPMTTQPDTWDAPCPLGLVREFTPITNIHIGIITSSLGGHGGDQCPTPAPGAPCTDQINPSNNDAGHLVSRKNACSGELVPTYGNPNQGFLAWDPLGNLTPPGDKIQGEIAVAADGTVSTVMGKEGIIPSLKDLVVGAGQVGCGFEAQLESWYRFLIDPEPYAEIKASGGKTVPNGTDTVLLQQRADFLRPSSLLAIIMLTDENDCSVKESSYYYLATNAAHLPRARKECLTNPKDPCCKSCALPQGACPADPTCTDANGNQLPLTATEDPLNLRCFDQKRRFGIDFLYPISRYQDALSSPTIPGRDGTMHKNPIFDDLNKMDTDTIIRDKNLVFIAGIVGVPWELIARKATDLKAGFKNSEEMKDGTWDTILGDPDNYIPPKDPHMIESTKPRNGLPGPTSPPGADPINGHEYTIAANDDLQYACIFDLPAPRDCGSNMFTSCDCNAGSNPNDDNPLCDPTTKTQQVRAKAYPDLRELSVLKAVDSQGIVASVCPAQLKDKTLSDYGYRPAIGSIIDRLKTALGGKCLPRELTPDAAGLVSCLILEASTDTANTPCDLKQFRREVDPTHKAAIDVAKADPIAMGQGWNKFCEIIQTGDTSGMVSNRAQLDACQQDASAAPIDKNNQPVNGWCYVDPSQNPQSNEKIVEKCAATEKRLIRFVGAGNPTPGGTLFITCSGQ